MEFEGWKQRFESIGRLAGGVAHDFNNLLTVIGGNVSYVLSELGGDSELREPLQEVFEETGIAGRLTRQLLAFSRKQMIASRVLDLNEAIEQLRNMLQRLIGEDVEVRYELATDLGRVKMDPGQLEQILINLCVNARDAMPEGGTLTLTTSNASLDEDFCRSREALTPGQYVSLVVSDTGLGIDEQTQGRIFEPFFTTKERGKGTGLGLAMVHGALHQNHGTVTVESNTGFGTSFQLYFPRIAASAPSRPPAADTAMPRGSEILVVVEDEEAVRLMATRVLSRQGYQVYSYPSGPDALAELARIPGFIALLLTDVIMPAMNGRVLAERAQELLPGLKVLYTSGYTDDVIAPHGMLEPGTRFLPKPYSVSELAQRVRQILDELLQVR